MRRIARRRSVRGELLARFPSALIARYGRGNMEEVFLDIARGRADERVAGSAAEESTA